MKEQILVVVDMQNDFIDGALGTKEAAAIVDKVREKMKTFDGEIVFTRDTHTENYLDTQEGKRLPVKHCIRGSKGWEITEKLNVPSEAKVFDKPAFGSVELASYLKAKEGLKRVELVGLCTDICVISNAMLVKAFLPEAEVYVDASCCAGVTPKSHENALEAMKMCQIIVV